jgi:hypothetical protein
MLDVLMDIGGFVASRTSDVATLTLTLAYIVAIPERLTHILR